MRIFSQMEQPALVFNYADEIGQVYIDHLTAFENLPLETIAPFYFHAKQLRIFSKSKDRYSDFPIILVKKRETKNTCESIPIFSETFSVE